MVFPLCQDGSEDVPKTKRAFAALLKFLVEVRQELKLINWPDWREVRSTTIVVAIFITALAIYVSGLGRIIEYLLRIMFHRRL